MDINEEILNGVTTGFVNKLTHSIPEYQPKLLTNGKEETVLSTIEKQLETCDEFFFSVAFVTTEGVAIIKDLLLRRCGATIKYEGVKDGDEPKIKGKILVSEYQYFTQPEALQELLKFDNIELRIVSEKSHSHTKGYIFRHNEHYTLIIGSSNLTSGALKTNQEWNLCVSSTEHGSIVDEIKHEFDELFTDAHVVDDSYIEKYREIYAEHKKSRAKSDRKFVESKQIVPNGMQERALMKLRELRSEGKDKALVISATGTGKTYLSAFDLRNFFEDEKITEGKFLFLVHRKNIAKAARETFKRVFTIPNGTGDTTGLLSGNDKSGMGKQFVFSTIMTFSKDNVLKEYSPNYFDYIVIDEAHRSAAQSYDKIFEHFKPKFMLGMTATPERTDDRNIYESFDHNIACDIRLNDALEEHMVPPFHYYGVADISVDGEVISDKDHKDKSGKRSAFNRLVCEERLKNIIRYSQFYGCDHGRIKGIIFCSKVDDAIKLSEMMNAEGFKTEAVSGDTKDKELDDIIKRLESDVRSDYLDYVIAVELLNEGVDIPSVNQIIMLRPTQSAIVFVQQLGRGLRKTDGKDYLTVIDFIGNYENNYLVPIALFGDNSYNRDNLRRLLSVGNSLIPGESTVHFDRVSLDRIFESINSSKINHKCKLKEAYFSLKNQLGKIPIMMDFVNANSRDPYAFVNYKDSGSMYAFTELVDEGIPERLSGDLKAMLTFFSKEVCNGIRIEEPIILEAMIECESTTIDTILSLIKEKYGVPSKKESILSAIRYINGIFHKKEKSPIIPESLILNEDGISRSKEFMKFLSSDIFIVYLKDTIEYAIKKFMASYNARNYFDGFILYNKYSRKDVCRILNWLKNEEGVVNGYKINHNTCPIFVTYKKSKDTRDSINYPDEFISNNHLSWVTRSSKKKSLNSKDVKQILAYKETKLRIPLFVKKSDDEGKDFYYLGDMKPSDETPKVVNLKGVPGLVVNIKFDLDVPVEDNLYNYLVGDILPGNLEKSSPKKKST